MVGFLEKAGCAVDDLSWTDAHHIIGKTIERRNRGLVASFKMIKHLKRRGYDTENMANTEAKRLMSVIAKKEGWKR